MKTETTSAAIERLRNKKAEGGAPARAKAPKKTGKAATAKKPSKPRAKAKKAAGKRVAGAGDKIIELCRRDIGASIEDLMKATGWQRHSVRGFLSTARKRGTAIELVEVEGARVYRAK